MLLNYFNDQKKIKVLQTRYFKILIGRLRESFIRNALGRLGVTAEQFLRFT